MTTSSSAAASAPHMPSTSSPFEVLADELGAVAGRIEREAALRIAAMIAEQRAADAERELRLERLERAILDRLASVKDGDPGAVGPPGKDGASFIGPEGERGEKGEKGETGDKGDKGEDGAPGKDGESIVGPKGDRGDPGEKGEKGDTGEAGPPGKDGEGIVGPPGERGEKGDPGAPGARGDDGAAGAKGDQGEPGERGPAGPPGVLPAVKNWKSGDVFYQGDVVAHEGQTFQARRDTAQPLDRTADWACLAARGHNGSDGRSWTIRDTYNPDATYSAFDVVTLNATWFAARKDNPGPCPGPDWKAGPVGKKGDKGERGERGQKGDKGDAGLTILDWQIDRAAYVATPVMSDGTSGPPLNLRILFEQFETETR